MLFEINIERDVRDGVEGAVGVEVFVFELGLEIVREIGVIPKPEPSCQRWEQSRSSEIFQDVKEGVVHVFGYAVVAGSLLGSVDPDRKLALPIGARQVRN